MKLLAGDIVGHVAGYDLAAPWSRRALAGAGLLVWLALAVGWSWYLWRHQTTPGEMANVPAVWPASSHLERDPARYTLVVFAHPQCPCVRATLEELRVIVARFPDRLQVIVISCAATNAENQAFSDSLAAISRTAPRTVVIQDHEQTEALRFGARTSGAVMLFRPDGGLAFHGGITAGRGHVGPNPGASCILNALEGVESGCDAPVFGCPLGICTENP